MKKTQRINLVSFKAESWPVAIRPARRSKASKPDRVLHLDVSMPVTISGATGSSIVREPRMTIA